MSADLAFGLELDGSEMMSQVPLARVNVVTPNMEKYFCTPHLNGNLGGRSVRGGLVVMANHAFKFVIYISGTMVLARILTPEDFGLIAMVSSITGLIGVLGNLGLSAATYQRSEVSHQQVSNLFWINIGLSFALTFFVASMAPAIAWFYNEPRLLWIAFALSSSFIFAGLTCQHYAILVRQMRFGSMAIAQTLPLFAGMIGGVGLALAGWGYWSLVGMAIIQGTFSALTVWICLSWRPGWPSRHCSVRDMVLFGGQLTAYDSLNYLVRNADNFLIGHYLGAAILGIYSKAYGLLLVPIQQINAPLNGVVLPALSRLQNDPVRFRSYYLKAVGTLSLVTVPITVFSYIDAEHLVRVLLGPQWGDAAVIFRMLTPAALAGTINLAPSWLFTSLGRVGRQLRWAYLSTPLILGGFAIGLMWGAAGVAASFSVTYLISFILFTADACRESPVKFGEFVRSVLPSFVASISAAAIVLVTHQFTDFDVSIVLFVDGMIFSVAYVSFCASMPGCRSTLRTLMGYFRRKVN